MINVLSVASEAYPLIKTGGLADVVGALPAALAPFGVAMRTLVPGYPKVMAGLQGATEVHYWSEFFGGEARLIAGRAGGIDILALSAPHLFDRPGNPYSGPSGDWADNWQRYAALSYAAYELAAGRLSGYLPQVVHCHDWQTGLVPAYLRYNTGAAAKSVMTVHNIAFQGIFGWDIFNGLRLDYRSAADRAIEYFGNISYLKAGLHCADAITTVSPTYAAEIRTPAFGMGLEGLLQGRSDALRGIINGIDIEEWNPGTDPRLAETYSAEALDQRRGNRDELCGRFGIDPGVGPIFSVVSRLTWQKGLDLLLPLCDEIVAAGGSLVVLGSGEGGLEQGFAAAAARHPGRIGTVIGYDEGLSHLIQGGADVMMVPSRFEPCGLTQLYGLRYGCVPLVSRTGGLADTVIDANEAAVEAGVATGIVFSPVSQEALREAIRRTFALYADLKRWAVLQRRGMTSDVSWSRSARQYANLYKDLLGLDHDGDSDD